MEKSVTSDSIFDESTGATESAETGSPVVAEPVAASSDAPVTPATPADTAAAEMELNVSLDQLSYICEYCGKVNAISSPSCVRCGKRRPRAEYINAMNRVKNAETVKAAYVEEQARLATEREEASQRELARLVEDRVADERAVIVERENARLEQEKDEIKRSAARDAVYRIIDAERRADERVAEAERRAADAVAGRDRATEERIATEREKVLYAAAKRVVSERAGIESAAEERIEAAQRETERKAQESIATAVDEAERSAARKATMKIIAGEQAAEDRERIMRDAISRAALDRVAEERHIAEMNAYAKFQVEREAIQRAVDERIRAERETLRGRRDAAPGMVGAAGGTVQPFAIVPYVNPLQPLYQYSKGKVVYKFVPDEAEPSYVPVATAPVARKPKKDILVRVLSLIAVILGAVILALCLADIEKLRFAEGYANLTVLTSLFGTNDFGTALADAGKDKIFCMLPPIAMIVAIAFTALTLILGIVGIIRNKQGAIYPIFAALALVGAAGIIVTLILVDIIATSELTKALGVIIVAALALIILILAIVAAVHTKKVRAAEKAAAGASTEEAAA